MAETATKTVPASPALVLGLRGAYGQIPEHFMEQQLSQPERRPALQKA